MIRPRSPWHLRSIFTLQKEISIYMQIDNQAENPLCMDPLNFGQMGDKKDGHNRKMGHYLQGENLHQANPLHSMVVTKH